MNKFNKKGFTLIEMLVVIAIIAVLVSIIIPTVTSATTKAQAATTAANLRSCKAELVTKLLTGEISSPSQYTGHTGVKFYNIEGVGSGTAGWSTSGSIAGGDLKVMWNGADIDDYAEKAGTTTSTSTQ